MSKGYFLRATVLGLLAISLLSTMTDGALIHRYSFAEGTVAKDSVGNVDGKLKGKATIADGKLVLKNDEVTSGDDAVSYLDFNGPVLPKTGSATIVAWFNAKEIGAYARLFNIGDQDAGAGMAFTYFVPRTSDDQSRAAITATDAGSKTALNNERLDDGKDHMVAVVIDGKGSKLHVFVDGKEAGEAVDLGDNTLDKVKQVNSWLGRSSFDSDAGYTGTIDEFRVYDDALKSDEVGEIFKTGANAVAGAATQPAKTP